MAFDLNQLGIDFTRIDDTTKHPVGRRVVSSDGTEFSYYLTSGSITAADPVYFSVDGTTVAAVTDLESQAGVAVGTTTNGQYAWFKTRLPVHTAYNVDLTLDADPDPEVVDVEAAHSAGQRVRVLANEYAYYLAGGDITAGQPVFFTNASGTVVDACTAAEVIAGVAHVDVDDGEYGWFVVKGPVTTAATTGILAGALVKTVAASGLIDDVAAAGDDSIGWLLDDEADDEAPLYLR